MGHEVRSLDLRCLNKHPSAIDSLCGGFIPDVVGLSIHGVPCIRPARECIVACRNAWPKAKFIAGGFLVKAAAEFVREHMPGDIQLFAHDSERSVEELAECLVDNKPPRPTTARIASTNGQDSYAVPKIDFGDLISPYYHPLIPYLASDFEIHIETQRGCPYGCRYCGTFPRSPKEMLRRDPDEVVEEMEALLRQVHEVKPGRYSYWVTDETFTADRGHAVRFCEQLLKSPRHFTWRAQTRADLVDAEILSLMRRSGCSQISFGIESLSDAVLRRASKGTDSDTGLAAMTIARKVGLKVRVILIIGLPGDSYTSIKRTFELLEQFGPDACQLYIYHPVPGSPEFEVNSAKTLTGLRAMTKELSRVGFLEAPTKGVGDLSRSDIVRWFLAANHVFPTRFNPRGDNRQLSRCAQGWRLVRCNAEQVDPLGKLNYYGRQALLEIAIASTGEFTREEIVARAQKVSGLPSHEIEGILVEASLVALRSLFSSSNHGNGELQPRLAPGIVLVRTSRGGLLCEAQPQSWKFVDDLLRRTYAVREDGYETLLRCNGHYSVQEIAHAVAAVLDKPALNVKVILSNLKRFRSLGFIEEYCHGQKPPFELCASNAGSKRSFVVGDSLVFDSTRSVR